MPKTLHEKLDSLGDRQVRTFEEIERSSQENRVMSRSIRESLAAQTEIMRAQVVTLEELSRQIARDGRERAEEARERAKEAREHDARMRAYQEQNEARFEMFRLAMVQLLDRIRGD